MVEVSPETRFDRMSGRQRTAVIGDVCLALFGRHSGPRLAQARAGEDTYRFDNKIGLRLPMPGFTSPRLTINSLGFREAAGNLSHCFPRRLDHLLCRGLRRRQDLALSRRRGAKGGASGPAVRLCQRRRSRLHNARVAEALQGGGERARPRSDWSMLAYLVEKNLRVLALQAAVDDPSNKLIADPTGLAAPFQDDLHNLVQTAKASGAKVAFDALVIRLRRDQTPEEKKAAAVSALYYMPYMTPDALIDGFDAYNGTIRKVAKEENATFVDAALAVPGDAAHFVDWVHFNDRGAAVMARVVSAGLPAIIQ